MGSMAAHSSTYWLARSSIPTTRQYVTPTLSRHPFPSGVTGEGTGRVGPVRCAGTGAGAQIRRHRSGDNVVPAGQAEPMRERALRGWLPAYCLLAVIWGCSFLFIGVGVTQLHPVWLTLA